MDIFLSSHQVLLKDFAPFARRLSQRLKAPAEEAAAQARRPFLYLASAQTSKEDVARHLLERDQLTDGLVCVLSCVEPCHTWTVRKDPATQPLGLRREPRQCLYLYDYDVSPEFGLPHVRLQTWFPFALQVCLNGREYLARQLDRAGSGYDKVDNGFTRLDDLAAAQHLLDQLTTDDRASFLEAFVPPVNPLLAPAAGLHLRGYYWSVRQCAYATDVWLRPLAALCPLW